MQAAVVVLACAVLGCKDLGGCWLPPACLQFQKLNNYFREDMRQQEERARGGSGKAHH